MKVFEFSIIASGLDPQADDFESRFYDAGCDDATVSFQKGHIILDFSREAETIDAALSTAVKAAKKAGATVDRIEPDPLVSLADIAARAGMSRAAMTQYSKGQRSRGFPAPIARVTSDNPLWIGPTSPTGFATTRKWRARLSSRQPLCGRPMRQSSAVNQESPP